MEDGGRDPLLGHGAVRGHGELAGTAHSASRHDGHLLPVAELEAIGFKLAAYPLVLLSAAVSAMQQAIAALQPDANTPPPPQVSFEELKKVVGFSEYYEREERYLAAE